MNAPIRMMNWRGHRRRKAMTDSHFFRCLALLRHSLRSITYGFVLIIGVPAAAHQDGLPISFNGLAIVY